MGRGRKIIPTVGVFPMVFGVFLRYFHPTVYIPRNFSVEFGVSPLSTFYDAGVGPKRRKEKGRNKEMLG